MFMCQLYYVKGDTYSREFPLIYILGIGWASLYNIYDYICRLLKKKTLKKSSVIYIILSFLHFVIWLSFVSLFYKEGYYGM